MDPVYQAWYEAEREKKHRRWLLETRNEELYEEGWEAVDTTDVTIRLSDGSEVRAHREVLEGQSAFFKNALKPGTFKESFTGVIHLPNDPPRAARDMIEFCYLFKYPIPFRYTTPAHFDYADEVFQHLDMLDIARVYMLDELHEKADLTLAYLIRNHWKYLKDNMFLVFELLGALEVRTKSYHELWWGSVNYMEAFIEDDVWTKLHEQAPDFIEALKLQSEGRWDLVSCRASGMFLDRLGGEHAVGMVIHQMKCPTCGQVQSAALGLVKPSKISCWDRGWGRCSGWAPSDEWFDVTKDNRRKNKKKKKAKKQKKAKRKAMKKKNSRG